MIRKKCTHIFPKEIILDMSADDSEINIIYQKSIIRTIFWANITLYNLPVEMENSYQEVSDQLNSKNYIKTLNREKGFLQ